MGSGAGDREVNDGELDMAGVRRALARKSKWIVFFTVGSFAAALAFVMTTPPRYTSEAKVLIENQESYFTRAAATDATGVPDAEAVGSQVAVIKSRDLARKAIRELELRGNPEFDPLSRPGVSISRLLGAAIGPSSAGKPPEDRIFEVWYERLQAFPLPKSRVISIEFSATDPDLAARAANKIADLYIEMQADAKRNGARAAAEALGQQVMKLRTRLAKAEQDVQAFRTRHGLQIGANNATLPSQQLAEVNSQLAAARTTQADALAKARLLREALKSGRLSEVPDIANDSLVRRIAEQRVSLRAQLALESRTYGPRHPRMEELNAQIAGLDSEMRAAAEKVARALENESRLAGARVDNILAAIDRQKRVVSGASVEEVRLRDLELEAKLLKEQLESTTQRWQAAIARQNSTATPGDARVISRAVAPRIPAFPKKIPILVFAALGGFLFSAFGIVTQELVSGRAFTSTQPVETPNPREGDQQRNAPARSHEVAQDDDWDEPEPRPTRRRVRRGVEPAQDSTLDSEAIAARLSFGRPMPMTETSIAEPPAAPPVISTPVAAPPAPMGAPPAAPPAFATAQAPARPRSAQRLPAAVFRRLARTLVDSAQGDYAERMLVCRTGEDVTDVSVPLARALAEEARTVLIDLGGAKNLPRLGYGLGDLLADRVAFADVIERDPGSRLHVVSRGRGRITINQTLETIIDALSQTYDFVVLAAPATGDHDLTLALAPAADHAIVVCDDAENLKDAEELAQALEESGAADVTATDVESLRRGATIDAA